MAQRAVTDPYPNRILRLLPRFPGYLNQCFVILSFFAFLLGSLTSSSHAQGYPSGRPIVGTSTNVLGPSPMFFDAAQFTGTDPCNQIANAIAASNTSSPLGTEIDAAGLSAVAVAGNLPPCTFQTANFLAGAIGGRVKLGGYTKKRVPRLRIAIDKANRNAALGMAELWTDTSRPSRSVGV